MPKYIVRWSEITIRTAIVDTPSKLAASDLIQSGVTPVNTTSVTSTVDQVLSIRPCVDLNADTPRCSMCEAPMVIVSAHPGIYRCPNQKCSVPEDPIDKTNRLHAEKIQWFLDKGRKCDKCHNIMSKEDLENASDSDIEDFLNEGFDVSDMWCIECVTREVK